MTFALGASMVPRVPLKSQSVKLSLPLFYNTDIMKFTAFVSTLLVASAAAFAPATNEVGFFRMQDASLQ